MMNDTVIVAAVGVVAAADLLQRGGTAERQNGRTSLRRRQGLVAEVARGGVTTIVHLPLRPHVKGNDVQYDAAGAPNQTV